MEHIIALLSNSIWSIFLPLLVITAVIIFYFYSTKVIKETTKPSKIKVADIIGPASISMGAMIGTGAIIGVLGSISSMYLSGQMYVEAIAGWAVLGALCLIPVTFFETLTCKITAMTPKMYISKFLNPTFGLIYAYCFIILYVFGFGGFQVSGINSGITIMVEHFTGGQLSEVSRYIIIVVPLLVITSAIVLTKKHEVFISAMAYMIGTAVILYLIYVVVFTFRTADYIPTYIDRLLIGMKNPVTAGIGLPIGLMAAFQRIIQTSEPGLGALGMASLDSNSEPRAAGIIALIPAISTVFLAIFVTSYITSYGYQSGIIDLSGDSLVLLEGFIKTAYAVAGTFGVVVVLIFTILSGITSLLGSYYFLNILLDFSENTNIAIYISLIFLAGTIAIFGGNLIFEAVDLLLFVVTAINVLALLMFGYKYYKEYKHA